MNFIEAHMIWHDFVDCLAKQARGGMNFAVNLSLKTQKKILRQLLKYALHI